MIAIAMTSTRVLALVAVAAALAASGRSASAGPHSHIAPRALSVRLPAYGSPSPVGRSQELGSVYVKDAIGSADFNGDGLPDVVYTTANSGSTSTFAMQFALNRGNGRIVDGGSTLFEGPFLGRRAEADS